MVKNNLKIINQLVDARVNSGYTQEEFAKKVGIKKSNLSRIESGKENISFSFLMKMISAYTYYVNLRHEFPDPNCDIYVLKQYDFELLSFKLVKQEIESEYKAEIISVNEELKHLLPITLELSNDSLTKFLKRRAIPKNRTYVEKILESQGLTTNDFKGILDVCMGLSLNDSYWVTKLNFRGKFEDYNLYENDFSTALAVLAYAGGDSSPIEITTSPEFTTGGMLPKAWRKLDNEIYLFKGSTTGFANAGNEAFAEYYASQILDAMGLNHVEYELVRWKNIIGCKCKLFTDINTSYVPIGRIVETGGLSPCLDYFKSLSNDDYEYIKSMIAFDCLVYNEDRHFGNFGVLIDNETNKVLKAAPIFDNGNSLFHYAMRKDFEDISKYSKTRTNPYGVSFDDLAKYSIGKIQTEQLKKLIGFKFKRHKQFNWPEWRLTKLEDFISNRALYLIQQYGK